MSRGLGWLQQEIKRILQKAGEAKLGWMPFADIRGIFIMHAGGNPETDKLLPNFERSLKRSLKALVDCGDVLRRGEGAPEFDGLAGDVERLLALAERAKHGRQVVE